MVFNANLFVIIVLVLVIVWLVILTIMVSRVIRHYNQLSQGVTKRSLQEVLEKLLTEHVRVKSQVVDLAKATDQLAKHTRLHVQKVGIVRFNPFADTGGSQSFTLALLDGLQNGIILTSLYGRAGNRWYLKVVKNGKGEQAELAKEEEAAIAQAQHVADIRL